MSIIKNAEEWIYETVRRGEMEIDVHGRIWRIGKRGWDRWNHAVRTNRCARVRAEKQLPSGYLMVRAMIGKKRVNGLAHRLVWRHFNGPLPSEMTINHKNGEKWDNRPANLELATRSENARHAVRVLRTWRTAHQWGPHNRAAKLTTAQVMEIRVRRANGEKLVTLAGEYGVTFQTISRVARGDRRAFG